MSLDDLTVDGEGLFAGRYQLERRLGRGGMGAVYLATDTMLGGEKIALKVLHQDLCRNEKHTKRFLREVQLTRRVTHPNVVRTFDVGNYDGHLFFTMEYVEGVTLKDKLLSGHGDPIETAQVIREVCKGLFAIHQADIIHRDLKPGNIVITPAGFVKIADFGIAKPEISDLTGHNEVIGSVPYMAPEVWVGRGVGPSADLYALGVVAYEMLTGVLPFEGDSPAELMCKHLESMPVSPMNLNSKVPEWLNSLVMRMLEKSQTARPAGVEEVVRIINHKLDGEALPEQRRPEEILSKDHASGYQTFEAEQVPSSFDALFEQPPTLDECAVPLGDIYGGTQNILEIQKESSPEAEKADPVATKSRSGRVLRIGLLLFLTSMSAYVAVSYANVVFHSMWTYAQTNAGAIDALLIIAATALSYCLLLSAPMFLFAMFRRSTYAAVKGWLKASSVLFILFGCLFATSVLRLEYKSYELNLDYDKGRFVSTAESALISLTEAVFLVPHGTVYNVAIKYGYPVLSENQHPTPLDRWPYFVLLAAYLTSFVRLSERWIFRRIKRRQRFVLCGVGLIGVIPIATETALYALFPQYLDIYSLKSLSFQFGSIVHAYSEFSLVCALVNWLVAIFVMTVVLPVVLRKARESEDSL